MPAPRLPIAAVGHRPVPPEDVVHVAEDHEGNASPRGAHRVDGLGEICEAGRDCDVEGGIGTGMKRVAMRHY